MLPTETTAEILSFLGLFDLSATLLATEKLSQIARICSKRLNHWTFRAIRLRSYVSTYRGQTQIAFWHADETNRAYEVVSCPTDQMTALMVAAVRNVVADSIDVSCSSCPCECLLDALRLMPQKSIVAKQLTLRASCVRGVSELFQVVDRFRGVKTLVLEVDVDACCMNQSELLAHCRARGLEKLQYGHLEFRLHIQCSLY